MEQENRVLEQKPASEKKTLQEVLHSEKRDDAIL